MKIKIINESSIQSTEENIMQCLKMLRHQNNNDHILRAKILLDNVFLLVAYSNNTLLISDECDYE